MLIFIPPQMIADAYLAFGWPGIVGVVVFKVAAVGAAAWLIWDLWLKHRVDR